MKQITIPHAVEKRVVQFLYRNGRYWSTREIANFLGEKREHVYSTLQNLFNQQGYNIRPQKAIQGDFVYKLLRGNEAFWCLRFDKIQEIEKRWGLARIPKIHKNNQEQTASRTVITPIIKILKDPVFNKVVRTIFITSVPIAREVYIGFLTANSLYAAWNTLYDSLKTVDQEDIERTTYETAKEASENILTDYQTEIIWNQVKSSIQPEYQDSVHDVLSSAVKKITEGEISIVENALQSL